MNAQDFRSQVSVKPDNVQIELAGGKDNAFANQLL